jgi:DNA-binding transcriptional regulator YdaS (Cro superfamily)
MRLDKAPILYRVFQHFGSAAELARRLGISRAAVSAWTQIPIKYLALVSRETGIKKSELRPDIFEE